MLFCDLQLEKKMYIDIDQHVNLTSTSISLSAFRYEDLVKQQAG